MIDGNQEKIREEHVEERKFEVLEEEVEEALMRVPNDYPLQETDLDRIKLTTFQYIDEEEDLNICISLLQEEKIIGVDIEEHRTRSYRGFICLIQISGESGIFLLDTIALKPVLKKLSCIFQDPSICKVFHAGFNDIEWLQRDFEIFTVNYFDTELAAYELGIESRGLNHLWGNFCGFSMSSEEKQFFEKSDWRTRPLSSEQLEYAANDARYLVFLMQTLLLKLPGYSLKRIKEQTNKVSLKKYTPRIANLNDCERLYRKYSTLPEDEIAQQSDESWHFICPVQELINISEEKSENLEQYRKYPILEKEVEIIEIIKDGLEEFLAPRKPSTNREQKKAERYQKFIERFTISRKVYENCQVQAPDGETLCFTDRNRANWYLNKDLAETISEDPLIIRLNFEPQGRGFSDVEADEQYYTKEKKNECVVCGKKARFLRYHVVPSIYRQAFPENFKAHKSHDVVLLCPECHERANQESDKLKKEISIEYEVPLAEYGGLHDTNQELRKIGKLSATILKHREKMPPSKLEDLVRKVKEFVEENQIYAQFLAENVGGDIEEEILYMAKDESLKKMLELHGDVNWKKEGANLHGVRVIGKLRSLKEFIRRWRRHFVETLEPRFLPDAWRVDHLLNSEKYEDVGLINEENLV